MKLCKSLNVIILASCFAAQVQAGIGSIVTVPVGSVFIVGGVGLGYKGFEEFKRTQGNLQKAKEFVTGSNGSGDKVEAFIQKYGKSALYGVGAITCLAIGKKLVIG